MYGWVMQMNVPPKTGALKLAPLKQKEREREKGRREEKAAQTAAQPRNLGRARSLAGRRRRLPWLPGLSRACERAGLRALPALTAPRAAVRTFPRRHTHTRTPGARLRLDCRHETPAAALDRGCPPGEPPPSLRTAASQPGPAQEAPPARLLPPALHAAPLQGALPLSPGGAWPATSHWNFQFFKGATVKLIQEVCQKSRSTTADLTATTVLSSAVLSVTFYWS